VTMSWEGELGYTPDNSLLEGSFVVFLQKIGVVSEQETKLYSDRQLYNKYVMGQGDLSLKEVVGLNYMAQAMIAFSKEDREAALGNMEKAYVFFSSGERIAYWILNEKMVFFKLEDWGAEGILRDIVTTSNLMDLYCKEEALTMKSFTIGYQAYLEHLLRVNFEPEQAKEGHQYVLTHIRPAALKEKGERIFQTSMGIAYESQNDPLTAYPYVLKAYQLAPEMRVHKELMVRNAYSCISLAGSDGEEAYESFAAVVEKDSLKNALRVIYLTLEWQRIQRGPRSDPEVFEQLYPITQELYFLTPDNPQVANGYHMMIGVKAIQAEDDSFMNELLSMQDSLEDGKGSRDFQEIVRMSILLRAAECFRKNRYECGEKWILAADNNIGKRFGPTNPYSDEYVYAAYWEYAAYYVRKANYTQARKILRTGIGYMTDPSPLQSKLDAL
ncbi:MAG: hypothetical protein AAFQ68_27890, partial [Bacteroidota bacterium]